MRPLAKILAKLRKDPVVKSQLQGSALALPENEADFFTVSQNYSGTISERIEQVVKKRDFLLSFEPNHHDGSNLLNGTPLSNVEISKIENKISTALPEDFRAFLENIGEGGSGPWCKLANHNNILASDMDYPDNGQLLPSNPFPLASAEFLEFDDQMSEEAYVAAEDQFWGNKEDGLIRVGNFGCAIFINLIVSGPERGSLWVRDPNIHGVFPITLKNKPDSRVRVLDWFENWLDYQINAVNRVTP
jgi:hypothetical protein